jgi:hypothetical protein
MIYDVIAKDIMAFMASCHGIVLAPVAYIWTLFSFDIIIFCIFSIIRNHAAFREFTKLYINHATIITFMTTSLLFLTTLQFFKFILTLKSRSDSTDGFSMQPMLFPCQTTHTRFFPAKHSFKYSYLLVGIPIGWKGSIGGMLSVDPEQDPSPWYRRILSLKLGGAWYTVNGDDYLERGHVKGGLQGKLEAYLISQV